jgi:hypothetical protein
MRAERILDIALRAYPAHVRRAHGSEIRDTVLDLSTGSWTLLRESLALVRGALRARVRVAAGFGTGRLVAGACCQAATLLAGVSLATTIARYGFATGWGAMPPSFAEVTSQALLAGFVLLALLGYDRTAALFGMAHIVPRFIALLLASSRFAVAEYVVAAAPVLLVLYGVMFVAPRTRRSDPRRLLWLAGAVLLAAGLRSSFGLAWYSSPGLLVLLSLPLAGLFLVAIGRPRLAIVSALVWTASAFPYWMWATEPNAGGWEGVLLVSVVATVVIAVLVSTTALRMRSQRQQLSS